MSNDLKAAKQWVEETLKELSPGGNAEMWWWGEETDGLEYLLLHVVGGGKGESEAFHRDVLRGCANPHSQQSRAQVRHCLVEMLKSLAAKGDR